MNCSVSKVLIIGYGNPLRGDDGIGWHVAQRLSLRMPDVEVLTAHQLLPEHAEPVSRSDLAVFIDASVDDAPGAWRCRELKPSELTGVVDSHALGVEETLAVAQRLYGRCPKALLYTIGGVDFSLGERLSPAVERAAGEVVEAIVAEVMNDE
jgi:hydrogenase maturation protease